MNEQTELRFPEPDETRALEKYAEPVGTLANDSARAPDAVQLDAIAHPDKYYCSVCGDSFASHSVACLTKIEEALATGARKLTAETDEEAATMTVQEDGYVISIQQKKVEFGLIFFFETRAELLADEQVARALDWNWQAEREKML